MENTGGRRPATSAEGSDLKRFKRRGSDASSADELPALDQMFNDRQAARNARGDDIEEDDMDDFIEEDEDEEMDEETRAEIRRQKKEAKRAAAKKVKSYAGADQQTRAELEDIFGAGDEYAAALEVEEKATKKRGAKMEDIFEPTEIADRYLLPADQRVRETDIPERHQFSTSTLSTNPVYAEITEFPPLDPATSWVSARVSARTKMWSQGFRQGDSREPQVIRKEFESAVRTALEGLFVENYEVPYLHRHQQDAFVDEAGQVSLLTKEELWMCYDLGLRYRAIHQKRAAVEKLYYSMKELDPSFEDEYFEDKVLVVPDGTASQSLEAGTEALDWLDLRYPKLVQAVKDQEGRILERKRAGGATMKRAKHEGTIGSFVENFGIAPTVVATNIATGSRLHRSTNPELLPHRLAESYVSVEDSYLSSEDVIRASKRLLIQEFGSDPLLLHHVRNLVKGRAVVWCEPTSKGQAKIDELHMYYRFKYLDWTPVDQIMEDRLFTQMLTAEAEGLIKIHFDLDASDRDELLRKWVDIYDVEVEEGDEVAEAWSNMRQEIIQEAYMTLLLPRAVEWLKDELKQTSEDAICQQCQDELERVSHSDAACSFACDSFIILFHSEWMNSRMEARMATLSVSWP